LAGVVRGVDAAAGGGGAVFADVAGAAGRDVLDVPPTPSSLVARPPLRACFEAGFVVRERV